MAFKLFYSIPVRSDTSDLAGAINTYNIYNNINPGPTGPTGSNIQSGTTGPTGPGGIVANLGQGLTGEGNVVELVQDISINSITATGTSTFPTILTDDVESIGSVLNIGCIGASTQSVNLGCATNVQIINVGTNSGTTTINLGGVEDEVVVQGTLVTVQTTNLDVTNKTILLNQSGAIGSSSGSGITVNEGTNPSAANFLVNSTRDGWILSTPAGNTVNLSQSLSTTDSPTFGNLICTNDITVNNIIFNGSTGITLSTGASSSINWGKINSIGYASSNNQWFNNSATGDLCVVSQHSILVGQGTGTTSSQLVCNSTGFIINPILTCNNRVSSNQGFISSGFIVPTTQGEFFTWNLNSRGETNFLNQLGSGSGGWNWIPYSNTNVKGNNVMTLTQNGLLSPTGGISLPNFGGISTTLNYYEEFSFSTTFAGCGNAFGSISFSIIKIGKVIMLQCNTLVTPSIATSSDNFISNTALPARFRPATNYVDKIIPVINSSVNNTFISGVALINNANGLMVIQNLASNGFSVFSTGNFVGWRPFSLVYQSA